MNMQIMRRYRASSEPFNNSYLVWRLWGGFILLIFSGSVSAALSISSPTSGSNVTVGSTVNFVASSGGAMCSDYLWGFGGAATDEAFATGSTDLSTSATLSVTGTYTITLSATSCETFPSPVSIVLNVNANVAPVATIDAPSTAVSILAGQNVSFTGSGSDSDGNTPLTYNWDFAGGASNSSIEDPGAVTFSTAGTYVVTLTVTDSMGATGSDTQTVTVSDNVAPVATIDTPSADVSIQAGESVSFTGSGSDSDGNTSLTYEWDFAGGASNSSLEDPGEVSFSTSGTYVVTFTVTDTMGATGSDTQTVFVDEEVSVTEVIEVIESIASTPNESSVSQALVPLCLGSELDSSTQADCDDLVDAAEAGDPEASNALAQITMDEVAAPLDAMHSSTGVTNNNINMRLKALRQGASGPSFSGLTVNVKEQGLLQVGSLLDNHAIQSGGAAGDEMDFGRWGVFLNGSISVGEKDDTDNEAGYDFSTKGLTFGVDYHLTDNRVLGAAFSYGIMDNDLNADGGNIEGNNYTLLMYGTQYSGNSYIDASLSYGWSDFDQNRNINYTLGDSQVNQSLSSTYDGSELAFTVGGGYQLNYGALSFGPVARLEYMKYEIDAFQEHGVDANTSGWAMAIEEQSQEVFNTRISGQMDYALGFSWGVLIPTIQLDWIHEFKGDDRIVNGRFVGDTTGSSFALETDVQDSDYFTLGAGLSTQLSHNRSAFIYYQTLLGKSDTEQYDVTLGLRWAF